MPTNQGYLIRLMDGGFKFWKRGGGTPQSGFTAGPDGEYERMDPTNGSNVMALLIAQRLRPGSTGSLTVAEIEHQLAVSNVANILYEVNRWDPHKRLWINESRGGRPASYRCTLDNHEVDVLDVMERGTRLLEQEELTKEDLSEVRELLEVCIKDPKNAIQLVAGRDDPFDDVRDVICELFERYIEHVPQYERQFNRRYRTFLGEPPPATVRRYAQATAPRRDLARATPALKELGVADAFGDLAGSSIDPEVLLDAVQWKLDFIGHTASKLRNASNWQAFCGRIARAARRANRERRSNVGVRLLLSAEAHRGEDERELTELQERYDGVFRVLFYAERPLFRITHVDGDMVAVQSYPESGPLQRGRNWDRGAIIFEPASGGESLYHAFVQYFESEWRRHAGKT